MNGNLGNCPMRHENGNCTVAGGFCTAGNNPICEALRNAFACGYRSALRQQETVAKCNDLFDEGGEDILHDKTVTDSHQMTNADRIRAMSDEELAEFLIDLADDGNLRIREWLQQPCEGGE